jgi:hypothetical protein
MKSVGKYYRLAVVLAFFSLTAAGQASFTAQDKAIISDFEKRVGEYSALRGRLEDKLPKIPKKATPEQIEARKTALLKSVQAARVGVKHGEIFTPGASQLLRTIIKSDLKGIDRAELRKTVFEAETKGVPVKANFSYPESKELVQMPPSLLLALPQLPKELRYRFVGTYLIIVDRESNLILDYMTNALP